MHTYILIVFSKISKLNFESSAGIAKYNQSSFDTVKLIEIKSGNLF